MLVLVAIVPFALLGGLLLGALMPGRRKWMVLAAASWTGVVLFLTSIAVVMQQQGWMAGSNFGAIVLSDGGVAVWVGLSVGALALTSATLYWSYPLLRWLIGRIGPAGVVLAMSALWTESGRELPRRVRKSEAGDVRVGDPNLAVGP